MPFDAVATVFDLAPDEIIVDNFAGGGGASEGIETALGRPVTLACNHDPVALAMHQLNHPGTVHYDESVWDLDIVAACGGRRVGLAWFSPDCTHFSKAKGAKPLSKKIRGLAWVAVKWARLVRPRVICMENVQEILTWGPLRNGRPCKRQLGRSFRRWVRALERIGYVVEHRKLRACDFGAPTTRERLFVVARCDGKPIRWPTPTHGPGRELPWRTAAECIDWSEPMCSIFATTAEAKAWAASTGKQRPKRPLARNTLARIARGLDRFVLKAQRPFMVPVTHAGDARVYDIDEPARTITCAPRGEWAAVAPFVVKYYGTGGAVDAAAPLDTITTCDRFGVVGVPYMVQTGYGERRGQAPRCLDVHQPLGTVVGCGQKHGVCTAWIAKHFGGGFTGPGLSPSSPLSTVTAKDHHALCAAWLEVQRNHAQGRSLEAPAPTLCAQGGHLAAVRALLADHGIGGDAVDASGRAVLDVGMRMLTPRELFRCQGFRDSYIVERVVIDSEVVRTDGTVRKPGPLTKEEQIRLVGNSVAPHCAAALVAALFRIEVPA
jgi:DNA (cytosine-5)-methyltransferase 1